MTSSLVGSEMCIRDRSLTSSPGHLIFWAAYRGITKMCKQTTSKSSVTVSYTHLTLPTICSV
eukprot:6845531-Prorocentrum_lima.AAC.1